MKNWFGILTLVLLLPLTLPAAEIPSQQQKPLGWYDWSKQKLQGVGNYVPPVKYWPGITSGLSGAALLGLRYAGPYLKPEQDKFLTRIAGYPFTKSNELLAVLQDVIPGLGEDEDDARERFYSVITPSCNEGLDGFEQSQGLPIIQIS